MQLYELSGRGQGGEIHEVWKDTSKESHRRTPHVLSIITIAKPRRYLLVSCSGT